MENESMLIKMILLLLVPTAVGIVQMEILAHITTRLHRLQFSTEVRQNKQMTSGAAEKVHLVYVVRRNPTIQELIFKVAVIVGLVLGGGSAIVV
jgi:hypothetical protein